MIHSAEERRMTVDIISWSIPTKVWDRAGIELVTPGSAVSFASVTRHVTDCATRPVRYVLYLSFVRTYKNLWNWHGTRNLMIFGLLTSPQGYQFDPRIKILLALYTVRHPRRFDMPHDHVWKIFFFTPSAPQRPKVWPLGHYPGDRIKIPSDICLYFMWQQTQSLV